jgi:hypothetical protein
MTKKSELAGRRSVLQAGIGLLAGGTATGAMAASASAGQIIAQEKLAPELVQYQVTPKDGALCSACVNWVAPNACNIVAGNINPNGWCVAYAPKNG